MMTVLYDLSVILIGVWFLISFCFQLISLGKLICFLTSNKWTKFWLFVFIAALSLLYLHDVLAMLIVTWGLPAISMTRMSYDYEKNKYINK